MWEAGVWGVSSAFGGRKGVLRGGQLGKERTRSCRDQRGGGVCRSPALRGSGRDPQRWPGQGGFRKEKGDDSAGRGGDDGERG